MQALARDTAAQSAGEAVAELFAAHSRMVLGLCRTLLRDPHDAEDAAQQSFLNAYRAILRGTTPVDPTAWLATIARNECRQRISRRLATPVTAPLADDAVAPASGDPAEQAGRHAEVAALASAVAELPERQREAIVLRDFYGLSYEEVAAAMSVSPPAVESLLSRGRRRLEVRVGDARVAAGVLVVPPSLQEQLAQVIPDFAPAAIPLAAGGGVAAMLTKIASAPVISKAAAAAAIATLAAGADQAIEHRHHQSSAPGRVAVGAAPSPSLRRAEVASAHAAAEQPAQKTVRRARSKKPVETLATSVAATPTSQAPEPEPSPVAPTTQPSPPAPEPQQVEQEQRPDDSSGPSASSGPGPGPDQRTDSSGPSDSSGPGQSGSDGSSDSSGSGSGSSGSSSDG